MTAIEAEAIGPEDSTWSSLLEACSHDFFHRPDYLSLEAEWLDGVPVGIYARRGSCSLLIPLVLVPAPSRADGLWDAVVPYGYAGPICSAGMAPDTFRSLLTAVIDQCRRRNIVSIHAREHPFLGFDSACMPEHVTIADTGPVVYVDLEPDNETILAAMRRNHRSDIASLLDRGFTAHRDDWTHWSGFCELYRATMDRLNAAPYYRYDQGYMDRLREVLGEGGHLVTICDPRSRVVAGVLVTVFGSFCHVHLSATSDQCIKDSPGKLAMYEAICLGKAAGARVCNLGGGVGGREDGLFRYKCGFSSKTRQTKAIQAVVMPDAYENLTREWAERCPNSETAPRFFPRYRACSRCSHAGQMEGACVLRLSGSCPAWCAGSNGFCRGL